MGNQASLFQESHVRIYTKLLNVRAPSARVQVLQTLLAGPEYVEAAKRAGIYAHLLAYVGRVRNGEIPGPLPWEAQAAAVQPQSQYRAVPQAQQAQQHMQQQQIQAYQAPKQTPATIVLRGESNQGERAHNYFQACLLVLGLEEEVALTDEALRTAYKRAAVRAHPDKGGSEEAFEAVSRAYAYLGDILLRIQGGRKKQGVVEAPSVLSGQRQEAAKEFEHVQPVKLNPKKLDMNLFNQMFEQNRLPDPESEGYGDWLKSADTKQGPAFSGKFNRDVFNSMFEQDARQRGASTALTVTQPEAMVMAPSMGTEIGRTYTGSYTAPANASLKYTDLKAAYTTENTFSHKVAGVNIESRNFEAFAAQRKKAPDPLKDYELEAIAQAERAQARAEEQRQLRAAQEGQAATQHFERMKRLVLMDVKDARDDGSGQRRIVNYS
jgi:curved DNA-binding protein CbpA